MSTAITQNEEIMDNVFEEDKKQNIIQLRELVKEDSDLRMYRKDDEYLQQFLYWTAFDVGAAIERMKAFQATLVKYLSWFATEPPLEVRSMLENNMICLLDKRDKEGRAIFVVKISKFNFSGTIDENASIVELVIDYAHAQEKTRENGICVILDMESLPWKLFTWLTPKNIKIGVQLIGTYPCKDIKIHLVKTSFILDAALKIVWPLLPEHIKEMIKFHFNNWSSLHEHVSPENLPKEYGGTGPDVNFDSFNTKLYKENGEIKEKLKFRKAIKTIEN